MSYSSSSTCRAESIAHSSCPRTFHAGSLSYLGMDSTYASAVAILRRIFEHEIRAGRQDRGKTVVVERDEKVAVNVS